MDVLSDIRKQLDTDIRGNRTNRAYVIKLNSARLYLKQQDIKAILKQKLSAYPDILKAIEDLSGSKERKAYNSRHRFMPAIEYITANRIVSGVVMFQKYGFGVMDMRRLIAYAEKKKGILIGIKEDSYYVSTTI